MWRPPNSIKVGCLKTLLLLLQIIPRTDAKVDATLPTISPTLSITYARVDAIPSNTLYPSTSQFRLLWDLNISLCPFY